MMPVRPDVYMPRTLGGAEYFVVKVPPHGTETMIVSTFLWKELRNVHTWPEWCQRLIWSVT